MKSYNLCDEPWISVRYKNGEEKKINLVQALKDSNDLELIAPVFRNRRADIYKAGIEKFLTILVMSAYYKESTDYSSKDVYYCKDLKEKGLYTDVVEKYLNETYDRFDLYSETNPFLQNTCLNKIKDDPAITDYNYIFWNPLVPCGNNHLFGTERSSYKEGTSVEERYSMDNIEFIHYLIYLALWGATPMAAHFPENSRGQTEGIIIMIEGKNLTDTVISNVFPLASSSRPNEEEDFEPDKPIWELNGIRDLEKYDMDILKNNELLLSFYPGISVLCIKQDENGNPLAIARMMSKYIEPSETDKEKDKKKKEKKDPGFQVYMDKGTFCINGDTKALARISPDKNGIRNIVDEKSLEKRKNDPEIYKCFNPSRDTSFALCLCATQKIEQKNYTCEILKNIGRVPAQKVVIYFRVFDGMKTVSRTFGFFNHTNTETWKALKDPDNHLIAEKYQRFYNEAKRCLYNGMKVLQHEEKYKDDNGLRDRISFRQNDWMEEDFFGEFTKDLIEDKDSALEKATDRLIRQFISFFRESANNSKYGIFAYAKAELYVRQQLNYKRKEFI